jgi:hypothetical protein
MVSEPMHTKSKEFLIDAPDSSVLCFLHAYKKQVISDGDPGGGGDPHDAESGVLTSLGEGLPSADGERGRLVPLFLH